MRKAAILTSTVWWAIQITGSTIQNVAGCGIRITGSNTISVPSCTLKACSSYGIYIYNCVGVTISGCSYASNWRNIA